MQIGVPREVKPGESRVALTPAAVAKLVAAGHDVIVEHGAGMASGFADADYRDAGAALVDDHAAIFATALVVKVKELQPDEYPLPKRDGLVLGFMQFAIEPALLAAACTSGATFVGCQVLEDDALDAPDPLPVLAAMSRIAGTLAVQVGALAAMRDFGGLAPNLPMRAGILLDDAPVVVIGAGAGGGAAARTAAALGARVTVMAASTRRFDSLRHERIACAVFDRDRLRAQLPTTRLLIGAVLVPGRTSTQLIDRAMIASMPRGAVFVDIGIDQRGIAETSRMTTLADPFVVDEGVIHCGVPNLPALVPRTASIAYSAAIEPYVMALATHGHDAFECHEGLAAALQVRAGKVVDRRLAKDLESA